MSQKSLRALSEAVLFLIVSFSGLQTAQVSSVTVYELAYFIMHCDRLSRQRR